MLDYVQRIQQGDQQALQAMVEKNMGLVHSIVRRYISQGYGGEKEDLEQAGCEGLVKALYNFDVEKGTAFSTYAYPCILGAIRKHLQRQQRFKMGREPLLLVRELQEYWRGKREKGEEPSPAEAARDLHVSVEEVLLALEATWEPLSMDQMSTEGGMQWYEMVGTECQRLLATDFWDYLLSLDARSRKVLFLRYFKGYTQTETGKALHISQVHVSRIEREIKDGIKGYFQS